MNCELTARFTAAAFAASVVLVGSVVAPMLLAARPAVARSFVPKDGVAAPADSPVGAVVMMPGTEITGTVPYGERTFRPDDRTLSCVVVFTKPAPGAKLRTEWFVVDGEKEVRFNEQDMTMGDDNAKLSIFTRKQPWPEGKYRVKVFVEGALDRAIAFNIKADGK